MPWVTHMNNGSYMLVYEGCLMSSNCDIFHKESADGTNWHDDLGQSIPTQHCGPSVISLTDGRVVVTSCANTISYSEDYGATWKSNDPAFSSGHWPGIYEIKPGEVAAVSDDGSRVRFGIVSQR